MDPRVRYSVEVGGGYPSIPERAASRLTVRSSLMWSLRLIQVLRRHSMVKNVPTYDRSWMFATMAMCETPKGVRCATSVKKPWAGSGVGK